MIEIIGMAVTVIAVAGAWLINRKIRFCFLLWMVSNLLSAGIHVHTGPWALVARDMIFLFLAIEGYATWGRKKDSETEPTEKIKCPERRW